MKFWSYIVCVFHSKLFYGFVWIFVSYDYYYMLAASAQSGTHYRAPVFLIPFIFLRSIVCIYTHKIVYVNFTIKVHGICAFQYRKHVDCTFRFLFILFLQWKYVYFVCWVHFAANNKPTRKNRQWSGRKKNMDQTNGSFKWNSAVKLVRKNAYHKMIFA